jgi:hypothetical protein
LSVISSLDKYYNYFIFKSKSTPFGISYPQTQRPFVAPGVTVGQGGLVGARSSVLSDMPEGMICMGSPAKPVEPRLS